MTGDKGWEIINEKNSYCSYLIFFIRQGIVNICVNSVKTTKNVNSFKSIHEYAFTYSNKNTKGLLIFVMNNSLPIFQTYSLLQNSQNVNFHIPKVYMDHLSFVSFLYVKYHQTGD